MLAFSHSMRHYGWLGYSHYFLIFLCLSSMMPNTSSGLKTRRVIHSYVENEGGGHPPKVDEQALEMKHIYSLNPLMQRDELGWTNRTWIHWNLLNCSHCNSSWYNSASCFFSPKSSSHSLYSNHNSIWRDPYCFSSKFLKQKQKLQYAHLLAPIKLLRRKHTYCPLPKQTFIHVILETYS